VVDSRPERAGPGRTFARRRAIATGRKKTTPGRRRRPARRAPPRRAAGHGRRAEQPLGVGVADAYAVSRLKMPARLTRTPKRAVREIGWAAFGEVARQLAARIAQRYRADAVVGIAKGGVFVGGALAAALSADFYPVRIEKRSRDVPSLDAAAELPDLRGKRVLVVDDVAASGATLARARALARKAGAKEVRTAVLVVRPDGARPDFCFLETSELVLFGWDYQLDEAGGAGSGDPGEVGV
jgi:hypoxanthine phosphoribosyltransferase